MFKTILENSYIRIISALVLGAVAGGGTAYLSIDRLTHRVENLEAVNAKGERWTKKDADAAAQIVNDSLERLTLSQIKMTESVSALSANANGRDVEISRIITILDQQTKLLDEVRDEQKYQRRLQSSR